MSGCPLPPPQMRRSAGGALRVLGTSQPLRTSLEAANKRSLTYMEPGLWYPLLEAVSSLNLLHIFGGSSGFGAALGVSLEPMEVKL